MLIKMKSDRFDAYYMDLLADERCQPLLSFLVDRNEKPTLREIKRHFPNLIDLDSYINDLVTIGVIERHHGKYDIALEYVSFETQLSIDNQVNYYLQEKLVNQAPFDSNQSLEILYTLFEKEESSNTVLFELSNLSTVWLKQPTRVTQIEGKRAVYVSLGSYSPYYSHNITDYFNFLTRNQINLPNEFINLRDRLGDINPEYFIPYCDRKLRRLEKGKSISINKPDLFLEALTEMAYCSVNQDRYEFNLTRFEKQGEYSELLKLKKELIELVTLNNHVRDVSFIVSSCLIQYLQNNDLMGKIETPHGIME